MKEIAITPELLREARFTESHFPSTVFKREVTSNGYIYNVSFAPENKKLDSYTVTIHQYVKGAVGLRDAGVFHGIRTCIEATRLLVWWSIPIFLFVDELKDRQADTESLDD